MPRYQLSLAAILLTLLSNPCVSEARPTPKQDSNESRPSLCEPSERVAFSCAMGKKQLAICQNESADTLIYKFGSNPQSIELQVAGTNKPGSPLSVERGTSWMEGAHRFYFSINVTNQNSLYSLDIEERPDAGKPAGNLMVIASKKVTTLHCEPRTEKMDYDLLNKAAK